MRYTLLDLTQTVLYSVTGDEVSSIWDTYESKQITYLIRTAYEDILSRSNLPELHTLFELTASNDSDQPVLMTLPDNIKRVHWIKYDKRLLGETDVFFQDVYFQPLEEFMAASDSLIESDTTVDMMTLSLDTGTMDFKYLNNVAPTYYTTYNDSSIIFNAIDLAVDTTCLTADKTRCYGETIPTWDFSDDFTPPLNEGQFQLLLQESKALAWAELKQAVNAKAEQSAKRNWVSQSINKRSIDNLPEIERLPHYGRK